MIASIKPYRQHTKLPAFLLCLLLPATLTLRAQDPISAKKQLATLSMQYQQSTLPDTAYLNAVDSLAALLYDEDSLEQWLDPYQQIAFSDTGYGKYRVHYYRHLMKLSDNKSRYGSAIYYSEKRKEESIKAGLLEKDELPHSELFAMAIYVLNKDYKRVYARYDMLRKQMHAMPGMMAAGRKAASPEAISMAFGVLDVLGTAAWKTGDSTTLNEAIVLSEKMLNEARKQPLKYREYLVYYSFIHHGARLYRAYLKREQEAVRDLLAISLKEVRSEDFGEINSPLEYACDRYMEAFDYYFSCHQNDSAQHYLDLIHELIPQEKEFTNERLSFWLEGNSKLLASNGHFKAAFEHLQKAHDMSVSAYYAVNADRDNNLYALAKAENTFDELQRSNAAKRRAEHFNILLVAVFGTLVMAGITGFAVYRSKQKRGLLNMQLGLARNFHDEIGPMMLYAGTLLKKESEVNPSPRLEELKEHVRNIMETVRGIAQDLKQDRLNTVNSFYSDITGLLEKIRASTEIDFKVRLNNGSRILSYLQYSNLKKIISEMVTNSIKHAECTMLFINLKVSGHHLMINYSDDGKGMKTGLGPTGIGIQNIRERVTLLKGEFRLNNK